MLRRIQHILWILAFCLLAAVPTLGQGGPAYGPTTGEVDLQEIFQSARSAGSVRSLIIQQHGTIVGEKYFGKMSRNRTVNIKSASKSIISLLVGIAINEGMIDSVDQPIKPYFQDYFKAHPDSIKEHITIRDLLTMRAGLETTSFYNYGRWVTSKNWSEYVLDQPLEKQPGSGMIYSTGSSHLLSVILTKATGMSTRRFAERYLLGPMGIRIGGWDKDPQGYYMGGNNMALSPGAMLKIGRMVQQDGLYRGQRIVPAEWLRESFRTYAHSNFNPYDMGYLWWKRTLAGEEVHFAWGYGGQYIFMLPNLDAVVVITSTRPDPDERNYKQSVFEKLEEQIIQFLSKRDKKKNFEF